jgi:RNA polymerase sigma factor for flagellar operon FliA
MGLSIDQNQVVREYSDYVMRIARQVKRTLPPNVDTEDLVGYGMTGLLEAAQRFDPSLGANFSTFSYYRIKGAIYDGLRSMGTLSRSEYKKQKFEEKAQAYLKDCRDCPPNSLTTDPEHELNELARKVQRMVTIYVTSMESNELNAIPDEASMRADDQMARLQLYEKMSAAIGKLSSTDQEIIKSYYFDELSLEEVGKKLGLSKSWTCRKHAKAVEKLSDTFMAMIADQNS